MSINRTTITHNSVNFDALPGDVFFYLLPFLDKKSLGKLRLANSELQAFVSALYFRKNITQKVIGLDEVIKTGSIKDFLVQLFIQNRVLNLSDCDRFLKIIDDDLPAQSEPLWRNEYQAEKQKQRSENAEYQEREREDALFTFAMQTNSNGSIVPMYLAYAKFEEDCHVESCKNVLIQKLAPLRNLIVAIKDFIQNHLIKPIPAVVSLAKNEQLRNVTFEEFVPAYNKNYYGCFFRNPFGMKYELESKRITTIEQVEAWERKKPNSRTAEVLDDLRHRPG